MPLDPNISLSYKPPQFENPMNMLAQAMQIQGVQNQNQLAQYTISKAKRSDDETNALAQLMRQPGFDLTTPEGQRQAYGVAPTVTPTYIKAQLDQRKLAADTGKSTSEAGKFDMDAAHKRADMLGQTFGAVRNNPTPEAANQAFSLLEQQGVFPKQVVDQFRAHAGSDPTTIKAFADRVYQSALSAKDRLAQESPDANARLTAQTSTANNAATNATSRANNAATNATHLTAAGMGPGGGMDENSERTAQAIANGQLPAPTGMALLNSKNQRMLGRVMEINPNYDASTVSAKRAAATAFTSGQLGNALRSVSTANAHLDQLGELADALGNGNTQVVNKVQNYFSKATGNPAVTNFDAIKAIVGQEVVKAIVAGGGGVQEREEAAKIFSSASSPQQLKGAIQHYRMVMGAQANNLMEQRRAAGLPDSTLPDYSKTNNGAPTVPDGWKIEKVN